MTRLRNYGYNQLGRYPWLFFPVMHVLRRYNIGQNFWPSTLTRETRLVIEGYPRSANSFVVYAFNSVQPRYVTLADHSHVPAMVFRAVAWGVPTIVLFREPGEAVLSLCVKVPTLPLKQALQGYVQFYDRILPYANEYVLVSFAEATTNLTQAVQRVNQRFGTLFGHLNILRRTSAKCLPASNARIR
jgi:hypothetical protein